MVEYKLYRKQWRWFGEWHSLSFSALPWHLCTDVLRLQVLSVFPWALSLPKAVKKKRGLYSLSSSLTLFFFTSHFVSWLILSFDFLFILLLPVSPFLSWRRPLLLFLISHVTLCRDSTFFIYHIQGIICKTKAVKITYTSFQDDTQACFLQELPVLRFRSFLSSVLSSHSLWRLWCYCVVVVSSFWSVSLSSDDEMKTIWFLVAKAW